MPGNENGRREWTDVGAESTRGLGAFKFLHPAGSFALTPASHVSIRALAPNQDMFVGAG